MNQSAWLFYVLKGLAVADNSQSFWKVGTAVRTFDNQGMLTAFSMRGRTAYGNYFDATLTRAGQYRANAVYATPQKEKTTVSYRPPLLGINAVASRIAWHPLITHPIVATKELDQVIAAFSDDVGVLIHDRGRLLSASPIPKFRGAIELIDGKTDLYDLVSAIATAPSTISRRKLTEKMRTDIEHLAEQLRPHREILKGNSLA